MMEDGLYYNQEIDFDFLADILFKNNIYYYLWTTSHKRIKELFKQERLNSNESCFIYQHIENVNCRDVRFIIISKNYINVLEIFYRYKKIAAFL